MELKLFFRNALDASCDGGTWNLLLDRAELDGKRVEDATDLDDLLTAAEVRDSYEYYNDNPGEKGVPPGTFRVGPHELRVEDLADEAGWGEDAPLVELVVQL